MPFKETVQIIISLSGVYLSQKIKEGWINYFIFGTMKELIEELGRVLGYKMKVIVLNQWKRLKEKFNLI